jgi:hypothetical protein
MFLKNYTSDVPVSQTLHRIEQVLVRCGVSGISKEYHPKITGKIVALTFCISLVEGQSWQIRLPVDEEKALQALWLNYADGEKLSPDGSALQWNSRKHKKRAEFREQAERTAWKIMQDWIEVQLSMIQMQQADFQQVFLPYVWDGKQTLYDRVKTNGYRALLTRPQEHP